MKDIILPGAEGVATQIKNAAYEIQIAQASFADALETNRKHMDDWLTRFESAVHDFGVAVANMR
jgi:hypothetical protein